MINEINLKELRTPMTQEMYLNIRDKCNLNALSIAIVIGFNIFNLMNTVNRQLSSPHHPS